MEPTALPSQLPHLRWLTGLRGLSALYVVCSHVWYHIWPAVPPPYGYGRYPAEPVATWTGWLYHGHFSVVVFIVLSGFCLMLRGVEEGVRSDGRVMAFYWRRARRILPPYYAALAFALLMTALFIGQPSGSQWDIALPVTARGVISHLLLLNDLIDATQINYVLWSIALEVHLYLLFPAFIAVWRRCGAARAAGLLCALIYGVVLVLQALGWRDAQFIGLIGCFVIGMAAASLAFGRGQAAVAWRQRLPWGLLAWGLGCVLLLLCGRWGHALAEQRFAALGLLCALATACLMVAMSTPGRSTGGVQRVLQSAGLVGIGEFSYSLYLIHAPLLQALWQYAIQPRQWPDWQQFTVLGILALPVCVLSAWVFYRLAERPFLSTARSRGGTMTGSLQAF